MNSLGLTGEDLTSAAQIARKYAAAVRTKLYWNMSPTEADAAIAESERVAEVLDAAADKVDSLDPPDLW